MKNYEMVMILNPGLDSVAFEEKSKFLEEKIKSQGGEVQEVSLWGKRKLAYDIKKKDAGYYSVINFQVSPAGLLEFKDTIKHDPDILRYLIVVQRRPVLDDRPVENLEVIGQKDNSEDVIEETTEEKAEEVVGEDEEEEEK